MRTQFLEDQTLKSAMFSINTINSSDRYLHKGLSGNILIQIKSLNISACKKFCN